MIPLQGFPSIVTSGAQRELLNNVRAALGQNQVNMGPLSSFDQKYQEMGQLISTPNPQPTPIIQKPTMAIINLDNGDYVRFRFVPRELSFGGEIMLQPIYSMGRNTPFYQYTGSEQNLEFEIDWFQMSEGDPTVMETCRQIESWGKNDADDFPPARLKIVFGRTIITDAVWLLAGSKYTVTQFYANRDMEPIAARQILKFVKLEANQTSWSEIQDIRR
jgi:hypothetical protein